MTLEVLKFKERRECLMEDAKGPVCTYRTGSPAGKEISSKDARAGEREGIERVTYRVRRRASTLVARSQVAVHLSVQINRHSPRP